MDPIELEPSTRFEPVPDALPRMEELPPVRLVAVTDVRLMTPVGIEAELDAFYVGMWQFERDANEAGIVYRAENVRLRFEVISDQTPIQRDTLRTQGIEINSLADAQHKLIEREMEFIRQRGLTPGQESLLLLDPAGNWIELFEAKRVM